MPRASRSTGVGRGNGPGSARSQFKDGMPSRNPAGRPRKVKERTPSSIEEAFARELGRQVRGRANGKDFEMPMFQAMVTDLLNDFPRASTAMKLRILDRCMQCAPALGAEALTLSSEAIAAFVERLAEEHRRAYPEEG